MLQSLNGPVVLRSKHRSQDDALDTETILLLYFFSNGKENEFSGWGGTKKDNEFSYQVNEDLLNPWFYTQGMIKNYKTE